jgi:hypothetical protein
MMGAGSIYENGFFIKLGTYCIELTLLELGWNLHCRHSERAHVKLSQTREVHRHSSLS